MPAIFGFLVILGLIGTMVVLVVVMTVLRSQGGNTAAVAVIGVILSLLAIFVIAVAGMAIYKSATEEPPPPGMPSYYSCIVTVVQDGVPLEGATVMLHPDDQSLAKWGMISGVTDAKGNAVMTINAGNGYKGAFQGEYKVTVSKTERSTDRNIFAFHLVDQKYNAPNTTPLELKVSRATKAKVDLGSAVRIEQKSFDGQREDQINAILKVVYPCKITILHNGRPVQDAEIQLKPTDFVKYAGTRLDFKGTTDAQGVASINPVPIFASMQRQGETYPEGVPADSFDVVVKIKGSDDFELRASGKKLETITISDKAFEQKYDLKDHLQRSSQTPTLPPTQRLNNTTVVTQGNSVEFNTDEEELGHSFGDEFSEVVPDHGYLVGFEVSTNQQTTGSTPYLVSLQSLYRSKDDEKQGKGKLYGKPGENLERAFAPKGYAVGGLRGMSSGEVYGFELVFMKINADGTLNPNDTQTSSWIGGREDFLPRYSVIDGKGKHVSAVSGSIFSGKFNSIKLQFE